MSGIISMAVKNTIRNKRRALVTLLVATIGTTAILVGGGFTIYTYDSLAEFSARDTGHLIVAHPDFFETEEDKPMDLGLENYQSIETEFAALPEVRSVLPRIQFSGLLSTGDKSVIFSGFGVNPEEEFKVKGPIMKLISGELLSSKMLPSSSAEILLGAELAKSLKVKIGDVVTQLVTTTEGSLNGIDLQVKGIVSTGVPEIDRRLAYISLDTAQKLLHTKKVSTLSIHLHETTDTIKVQSQLLSKNAGTFAIKTWLDQAIFYISVKNLYDRIFGLLGLIILLLVFFAVSNTIQMAVAERTREVGSLRAMGAFPREIIRDFTLEGVVLGFASSILGSLFAASVAVGLLIFEFQMPPPPGRSEGYPLAIAWSWNLWLVTMVVMITICAIAALISSRTAVRKPIVEALNHV